MADFEEPLGGSASVVADRSRLVERAVLAERRVRTLGAQVETLTVVVRHLLDGALSDIAERVVWEVTKGPRD